MNKQERNATHKIVTSSGAVLCYSEEDVNKKKKVLDDMRTLYVVEEIAREVEEKAREVVVDSPEPRKPRKRKTKVPN